MNTQRGDQIPFIVFTGRCREEVAIEALNTITSVSPQIASYGYAAGRKS